MTHRPYPLEQWQNTPLKYNLQMMVKFANAEYKMYRNDVKSGSARIVHLQEAGEKLFNAIETYVQIVYGIMGGSHYAVMNLIQEEALSKMFQRANALHEYFYEGEAGTYRRRFVETEFLELRAMLNERMRRMR